MQGHLVTSFSPEKKLSKIFSDCTIVLNIDYNIIIVFNLFCYPKFSDCTLVLIIYYNTIVVYLFIFYCIKLMILKIY
jgi:hypothetical protein